MGRYTDDNNDFFDGDSIWDDAFGNSFNDESDAESLVFRLNESINEGRLDLRSDLVDALVQLAWKCIEDNKSEESLEHFDEAIVICRELIGEGQMEHRGTLGKIIFQRALEVVSQSSGNSIPVDLKNAIEFLEQSVNDGVDDNRGDLAIGLMLLGDTLCNKLGSYSAGLAKVEQAIGIWESMIEEGNTECKDQYSGLLRAKGDILREIGDMDAAIDAFVLSENVTRELIDEGRDNLQSELLRTIIHKAETYKHFQAFNEAHMCFDEAIDYCRNLSDRKPLELWGWLPSLFVDKARIFRDSWDYGSALDLYDKAVYEFEHIQSPTKWTRETDDGEDNEFSLSADSEIGNVEILLNWQDFVDSRLAQIHSNRGCLLHDLNRFDESQTAFDKSIEHYDQIAARGKTDVRLEQAMVRLNNAKILLDSKQFPEAIAIQEKAIEILNEFIEEGKTDLRGNLAQAYRELGVSLSLANQPDSAVELFDKSVDLWRTIVDEGEIEKQEQLAHSLLIRSDFYLEQKNYKQALSGFIESRRIREELFDEGDWLVALPLVRTIFTAARAFHLIGDYDQSLEWCVQALKLLEQIRAKGTIAVDDYILEGTRRCLGILLDMNKPDEVLNELNKTFRFIKQLRNDGNSTSIVEAEIPFFLMYKAHAWGLKQDYAKEMKYDLKAIKLWLKMLRQIDPANEQQCKSKQIEYHLELNQAVSFYARACDRNEDHQKELVAYKRLRRILKVLMKYGVFKTDEEWLANEARIGITLCQLGRLNDADKVYDRLIKKINLFDETFEYPTEEDGTSVRHLDILLWVLPHCSHFYAETGRPEKAIALLNFVIQILRKSISDYNENSTDEDHEDLISLACTLISRLRSVASLQHDTCRYDLAIVSLDEAAEISQMLLQEGNNEIHGILLGIHAAMAETYRLAGKLKEARDKHDLSCKMLDEFVVKSEERQWFITRLKRVLGHIELGCENYDAAYIAFEEVIDTLEQVDENSKAQFSEMYFDAKTNQGICLTQTGKLDEALRLYDNLIPQHNRILDMEENVMINAQNRREPTQELNENYNTTAWIGYVLLLSNMSYTLYCLEKYESALETVDEAIRILQKIGVSDIPPQLPTVCDTFLYRGKILIKMDRYDEAIAQLDELIDLYESGIGIGWDFLSAGCGEAIIARAEAHTANGNPTAAENDRNRAAELYTRVG